MDTHQHERIQVSEGQSQGPTAHEIIEAYQRGEAGSELDKGSDGRLPLHKALRFLLGHKRLTVRICCVLWDPLSSLKPRILEPSTPHSGPRLILLPKRIPDPIPPLDP